MFIIFVRVMRMNAGDTNYLLYEPMVKTAICEIAEITNEQVIAECCRMDRGI